jgi:CRISPR-associated protein Cas4
MRIHISTLNEYTFCPRSVYLSKVLNIRPELSPKRAKGIVGHAIRKELSLRQSKLLGDLEEKVKSADELEILLLKELDHILRDVPYIYKDKLEGINLQRCITEIRPELLNEIKLISEKLNFMIDEFGIDEALKLITPWKVEFSIKSEKLKFSGRIDKVMKEKTGYVPIEIKTGNPSESVWEGDRLQICAYAILLEDKFRLRRKIPLGYVEYTQIQEKRPVMTTEQLRRRVIYVRDEILEMLKEKKIPEICSHGSGKKCESCGFKEVCYEI